MIATSTISRTRSAAPARNVPNNVNALSTESATFPVVILYEDQATGKRAMEMYHYVARQFEAELTPTCQMWRFDVLQIPALRELALKELSEARLILFSARSGFEIPHSVKALIQEVCEANMDDAIHECAVAALIAVPDDASEAGAAIPFRDHLREVAHGNGMAFFSATYKLPGESNSKCRINGAVRTSRFQQRRMMAGSRL